MEAFKTRGHVSDTTLKYVGEGLPPERRQTMSDVRSVGRAIFEAMGQTLSSSRIHGWSVDTPDVDNVGFGLVWRR